MYWERGFTKSSQEEAAGSGCHSMPSLNNDDLHTRLGHPGWASSSSHPLWLFPAARSWGPGTVVFTRERGLSPPQTQVWGGTASWTETEKLQLSQELGAPGKERSDQGSTVTGEQQREPKAETHQREQCQCPVIILPGKFVPICD